MGQALRANLRQLVEAVCGAGLVLVEMACPGIGIAGADGRGDLAGGVVGEGRRQIIGRAAKLVGERSQARNRVEPAPFVDDNRRLNEGGCITDARL